MSTVINNMTLTTTVRESLEPGLHRVETTDKPAVSPGADQLQNQEIAAVEAEQVKAAIIEINKNLALHSVRFEYSVHEKTNAVMVKVVNEQTGELIREVPPKKVLDIMAMTWEEMGIILDEKV